MDELEVVLDQRIERARRWLNNELAALDVDFRNKGLFRSGPRIRKAVDLIGSAIGLAAAGTFQAATYAGGEGGVEGFGVREIAIEKVEAFGREAAERAAAIADSTQQEVNRSSAEHKATEQIVAAHLAELSKNIALFRVGLYPPDGQVAVNGELFTFKEEPITIGGEAITIGGEPVTIGGDWVKAGSAVAPEKTIESSRWTGRIGAAEHAQMIVKVAPLAVDAVGHLIDAIEAKRLNDPATQDALTMLKDLHQALGELIRHAEQGKPLAHLLEVIERHKAQIIDGSKAGVQTMLVAPTIAMGTAFILSLLSGFPMSDGMVTALCATAMGKDALLTLAKR